MSARQDVAPADPGYENQLDGDLPSEWEYPSEPLWDDVDPWDRNDPDDGLGSESPTAGEWGWWLVDYGRWLGRWLLDYASWLGSEIDRVVMAWIATYATRLLQVAIGLILFWFGVLKIIPGLSPAEQLVMETAEALLSPLGVSPPGRLVIIGLALWEVAIGLGFLFDWRRQAVIWLLIVHMMSTALPLVLLPDVVWRHPPFVLTLEGQYIVKNLVIVAGAIILGTIAYRSSPRMRSAGGVGVLRDRAQRDASHRLEPEWLPGVVEDDAYPDPGVDYQTGGEPRAARPDRVAAPDRP